MSYLGGWTCNLNTKDSGVRKIIRDKASNLQHRGKCQTNNFANISRKVSISFSTTDRLFPVLHDI